MPEIFRISEAATLALHSMTLLAEMPGHSVSTKEMAATYNMSGNHLAKVMQRLHHARLVKSVRGPSGGFALSRPADQITLLEVYEAIEGPIEISDCLFGDTVCNRNLCILGGLFEKTNREIQAYLRTTSLQDLVEHEPQQKAPPGKTTGLQA